MKMFNLKGIIFLVLFLTISVYCCPKNTGNDPYNFLFTERTDFKWLIFPTNLALSYDKNKIQNEKTPLLIRRDLKTLEYANWNTVLLYQRIVLPHKTKENLEVTIHNDCGDLTKGLLCVNSYNNKMELLRQDSIDINIEGWNNHKLVIEHSDIKVIDIAFNVTAIVETDDEELKKKYEEPGFMQYIALDKMQVKIDGKDISSLPVLSKEELGEPVKIDSNKIIPLNFNSKQELIPIQKKILGLGETVHFNNEIEKKVFEIIKNRIIHNNCRLVLLETPYNRGLLFNYYASGAPVSDNFIKVLRNEGKFHISNHWLDFLNWVREYNKKQTRKVLVLGIDENFSLNNYSILEVLHMAITSSNKKQNLNRLVNYIADNEYTKAKLEIEKKENVLKEIFSIENFELFKYFISMASKDIKYLTHFNKDDERFLNRDKFMYNIAEYLINSYTNNKETVCIYTHLAHLAKSSINNPNLPLGYYINNSFSNQYASMAIIVGKGRTTIKEINSRKIKNIALSTPPQNSIEYSADKILENPYLYFFNDNNYPLTYIRTIGLVYTEEMMKQQEFNYLFSPKGQTDGFVFLPEGSSIFAEKTKEYKETDNTFIYNRRLKIKELYPIEK